LRVVQKLSSHICSVALQFVRKAKHTLRAIEEIIGRVYERLCTSGSTDASEGAGGAVDTKELVSRPIPELVFY